MKNNKMNLIAIIIEIIFIALFFVFFSYEPFNNVDPNVKATIIAGLFGLLGWTIQHEYQTVRDFQQQSFQRNEEYEKRLHEIKIEHENRIAQIRLQNYDNRKEMYESLLLPFITMFRAAKEKKPVDLIRLSKQMDKNNIQVHLLGSDEACRAWEDWFQLAQRMETEKDDNKKKFIQLVVMILYARIVLSIRKDLGNEETEIDEIDFLRSFIKDIDDILPLLRKAQKVKSIEEIE